MLSDKETISIMFDECNDAHSHSFAVHMAAVVRDEIFSMGIYPLRKSANGETVEELVHMVLDSHQILPFKVSVIWFNTGRGICMRWRRVHGARIPVIAKYFSPNVLLGNLLGPSS
jgi:hypothetical protein